MQRRSILSSLTKTTGTSDYKQIVIEANKQLTKNDNLDNTVNSAPQKKQGNFNNQNNDLQKTLLENYTNINLAANPNNEINIFVKPQKVFSRSPSEHTAGDKRKFNQSASFAETQKIRLEALLKQQIADEYGTFNSNISKGPVPFSIKNIVEQQQQQQKKQPFNGGHQLLLSSINRAAVGSLSERKNIAGISVLGSSSEVVLKKNTMPAVMAAQTVRLGFDKQQQIKEPLIGGGSDKRNNLLLGNQNNLNEGGQGGIVDMQLSDINNQLYQPRTTISGQHGLYSSSSNSRLQINQNAGGISARNDTENDNGNDSNLEFASSDSD